MQDRALPAIRFCSEEALHPRFGEPIEAYRPSRAVPYSLYETHGLADVGQIFDYVTQFRRDVEFV